MALAYDRPVTYQSNMFNPHSEFEHKLNIKLHPQSNDFFTKDPTFGTFFQEPSMNDFKHKLVLNESAPQQLISWTRKHPQHWTRREVLDWIYFVVEQEHLDGSKLQGEAYNNFVGEDLCKMDKKQFLKADPYYGSKMYETFRNLINDVSFEEPKPSVDISCLDTFNMVNNLEYTGLNRNIHRGVIGRFQQGGHGSNGSCNNDNRNNSDLMVFRSEHDIKVNLTGLGVYSISPEIELPLTNSSYSHFPSKLKEGEQFTQPLLPFPHSQLPEFSYFSSPQSSSNVPSYTKHRSSSLSSAAYQSTSAHSLSSSRQQNSSQKSHTPSLTSSFGASSLMSSATLSVSSSVSLSLQHSMFPSSSPCRIDKTDPGFLSNDSCSSPLPTYQTSSMNDISFGDAINMDVDHTTMTMSASFPRECTKPKKKEKKNRNNATKNGNHLWEFVRELLRNPEANPKLLKWEDRDNGVFRFVQSEKVAKLWGEKKNNPLMTYEKLSRAMRFCRSTGYFDNVPKTGKFPKKLCFRFGDKARGWKD